MQKIQNGSYYFHSNKENVIYDIYELFKFYDQYFFQGTLEKCTVQWSQRMTLCAGTCENKGFGSCSIKLSEPLLKFRTTNELKQTILHQMIHAYLFITNPKACVTQGGHGKQFKQIMNSINTITGLKVTIYHNFVDEVDNYRTHIWRCNGSCQTRSPYFGYVKRSMNRKPQPADSWWNDHERNCGGQFIKISQPQKTKIQITKNNKKLKGSNMNKDTQQKGKTIQDYVKQMQQRSKNKKAPQNKSQSIDFSDHLWISEDNDIQNKKRNNKKDSLQKGQGIKNRRSSKQKPDISNNHKISSWLFDNTKGKTIQQYSNEIWQSNTMLQNFDIV